MAGSLKKVIGVFQNWMAPAVDGGVNHVLPSIQKFWLPQLKWKRSEAISERGSMSARIIDGTAIAKEIQTEIAKEVAYLKEHKNIIPLLGVLLVGNNPASEIYVRKKREACDKVGIKTKLIHLFRDDNIPKDAQKQIEGIINRINCGIWEQGIGDVPHGVLVQLPLPKGVSDQVFSCISPLKDVDVLHPENIGLLVQGNPRFKPCTPHGIQQMLYRSGIPIAGQHVVVINRSNIVGKPLSSMLIQDNDDYANATVTVCHNRTPSERLRDITLTADIIIVAVGIPGFLKENMVRTGTTVIDVGITRIGNKILGDVDIGVREVAGAISCVPGGVGPVTCSMLLLNTVRAAVYQKIWGQLQVAHTRG